MTIFTIVIVAINFWVGNEVYSDTRITEFAFPSLHNLLCNLYVYVVYMQLAFNINLTGYLVDFKGYAELSGQEKLDQKLGMDLDDDELEDFQILER